MRVPNNAYNIIKILQESGYSAYLVGGCIRDMVMRREPHDWDICTSAKPNEMIEVLDNSNYKYHTQGIEFGTITVMANNEEYEITTYRSDGKYGDLRRPNNVVFKDSIKDDLSRRDFTINALAYDPVNDVLIDEFNGIEDIESHTIRAIGDATERFSEDGLRILRALRFSVVFNFDIEINTEKSMKQCVSTLDSISKERVTNEFYKMLTSGSKVKEKFTRYSWLIAYIIPEIKPCIGMNQNSKYHEHEVYEHMLYVVDGCKTDRFEIKLAALLHDIGKPSTMTVGEDGYNHYYKHDVMSYNICKDLLKERFCLTKEQYKLTLDLIEKHDIIIANTVKSVKRAMNSMGSEFIDHWIVLKESDMNNHINLEHMTVFNNTDYIKKTMHEILEDNQCFNVKMLDINGNDIISILHIKPGKVIGDILNFLLEQVIEGKLENNKEDLIGVVKDVYG